jgi:ribosome-associated heat shock protein Hsp15
MEKLRADKYLWSIRLFKTRSQAADACESGKVKCLGNNIKPARTVAIGDVYTVRAEGRGWVIKVVELLDHRVQYSEAIKYYEDITPEEDKTAVTYMASAFDTGKRQSKIGRPTKKQRRDIDGFMAD